ncbi:MAG: FIST C-terminal domain-containing protein [Geopsychrobacter sp.]|nr:FIST C-terminal domain-containing protein [Geopsychrobacter sp.]
MKIATSWTTDLGIDSVLNAYENLVSQLDTEPTLIILSCSVAYDLEAVLATLRTHAPQVPLSGGTSCMGVLTQAGVHAEDGCGLALFGIYDPEGSYGVGATVIGEEPEVAAQQAIHAALEMADCPGEVPAMVWMSAAPGCEESLISGIGAVLGEDVPITGGSSADNQVQGDWRQFANDAIYSNAVVVTALFPSTEVMFAFHSGYEPTDVKGIVTKAGGFEATEEKGVATRAEGRILWEINGLPAAAVYNDWSKGLIEDVLTTGGNILGRTTLHPLGRIAGHIGDVPYYQLSHPDAVTENGGLSLFSNVAPGDELVLMHGTIDSLVSRAGRVASSALETYSAQPEDVAGALVVYCAGCMLTVQDRLNEVVDSLRNALPGVPFLGVHTFGEQGCFLSGENRHGNLMISVLLFSK